MKKNPGIWLLVFIFSLNTIGLFLLNLYRFWFFDVIMHFFGGLGVYLVAREYFSENLKGNHWLKTSLLLVGIVMFVGVLWEFMEYNVNTIWLKQLNGLEVIGDLNDTLKDLAMDMVGGIFGSFLHLFRHRKS